MANVEERVNPEDAALAARLRDLPVPPVSAGFLERALAVDGVEELELAAALHQVANGHRKRDRVADGNVPRRRGHRERDAPDRTGVDLRASLRRRLHDVDRRRLQPRDDGTRFQLQTSTTEQIAPMRHAGRILDQRRDVAETQPSVTFRPRRRRQRVDEVPRLFARRIGAAVVAIRDLSVVERRLEDAARRVAHDRALR